MGHQKILSGLVALGVLAGCTTPDVGPQIAATSTAFAALKTATRPTLEAKSKAEFEAAEERMIQNGELIVLTTGDCLPEGLKQLDLKKPFKPCALQSQVDVVSGPVNASQVIALETGIEVYLASLLKLADATSATEIETQTAALIVAVQSLADKKNSASLTKLAAKATAEKERVAGAAGFVANQSRHRALAKAVRRAERQIKASSQTLYDYYVNNNPELIDAATSLNTKQIAMLKAAGIGNAAQHRAAIKDFRAAHTAFDTLYKADPGTWYAIFARAHTALHKRLQSGGDVDDLITTIDALEALKPTP